MYLKTDGLVLRQVDYRDADQILTILTPDYGKLTVKAQGVRSRRSQIKSGCQVLTYSEFTLLERQGRYIIKEAVPKQMFLPLRTDLELLSLASYFAQVSEAISQEDAPNPRLLATTLNCVYMLCQKTRPRELVKAVFELRMACLAGYEPMLDGCISCGETAPQWFDITSGCLYCQSCRPAGGMGICMPIPVAALAAMRYLIVCPDKRLFSFSIPEEALTALGQLSEAYLCTQLEHSFSSLDFYKSLLLT